MRPDDTTLARLVDAMADTVIVADADSIGQSLDPIIPEGQRRAHRGGYRAVMASGAARYGTVSGIAAVGRDDPPLWAVERALRAEIAELRAAVGQAAGDE